MPDYGIVRKRTTMTIGDRIFNRMKQLNMSQKEFSERTGISQSTISEWKTKRTNPTSEKIMIICQVLKITPEWLLSGAMNGGNRGNELDWFVVDKRTDLGLLISAFNELGDEQRARLMGYMEALNHMDIQGKK